MRILAFLALLLPLAAQAQPIPGTYNPVTAPGGTTNTLAGMFASQITAPIATGVAATDTVNLQAALTAVPANGAIVMVPAGTYVVNNTITVNSNTKIACSPGAIFQPVAPGSFLGAHQYTITNANNAAGSITDHDIVLDGCSFDNVNWPTSGFNFYVQWAARVLVNKVYCFNGGGDCTAMVADADTIVENSYSSGNVNSCWDHWYGATKVVVRNNYCSMAVTAIYTGYGIMVTGSNGSNSGVSDDVEISGNTVVVNGTVGGAGIILNGVGLAGSGVTNGRIHHNKVDLASSVSTIGIALSGGGTQNNVIDDNEIVGGNGTTADISEAADAGGTPAGYNIIRGNRIVSPNTSTRAVITIAGGNTRVENNVLLGTGTLGYALSMNGANERSLHNEFPGGSSGVYQIGGGAGTTYLIDDVAGPPPTGPTSCGTGSPALVSGSSQISGQITLGTGSPTACTIGFARPAFGKAPSCTCSSGSAGSCAVTAVSTSSVTFTLSATAATLYYICKQLGL